MKNKIRLLLVCMGTASLLVAAPIAVTQSKDDSRVYLFTLQERIYGALSLPQGGVSTSDVPAKTKTALLQRTGVQPPVPVFQNIAKLYSSTHTEARPAVTNIDNKARAIVQSGYLLVEYDQTPATSPASEGASAPRAVDANTSLKKTEPEQKEEGFLSGTNKLIALLIFAGWSIWSVWRKRKAPPPKKEMEK